MHVRHARDGVVHHFHALKSAASVEAASDVLRMAPSGSGIGHLRYSLLPESRSAFLALPSSGGQGNPSGTEARSVSDPAAPFFITQAFGADPLASLTLELSRRAVFHVIRSRLHALLVQEGERRRHSPGGDGKPLLTPQACEEAPSRWVMEAVSRIPGVAIPTHRTRVVPSDVGRLVHCNEGLTDDGATYRIVRTAPMCRGEYWVEIILSEERPDSPSSLGHPSQQPRRVDCANISLVDGGVPIYTDAFLPSDESFSERGTSACLFLSLFLAESKRRRPTKGTATFPSPKLGAGDLPASQTIPTEMAHVVYDARASFVRQVAAFAASRPHRAATPEIHASQPSGWCTSQQVFRWGTDALRLRTTAARVLEIQEGDSAEVEVLLRTVMKLSRMWDARLQREEQHHHGTAASDSGSITFVTPLLQDCLAACPPQNPAEALSEVPFAYPPPVGEFLTRLTTMLLRYETLFGPKGYNQGPQAAIPPTVMAQLLQSFDVRAEAFASPLNAQLPQYGSLFPDTDAYFGSVGSFFDLRLTAGHVEVNPPFDTFIMDTMQQQLLDSLEASEKSKDGTSLLYVVVLPSHDPDEGEAAVRDDETPRKVIRGEDSRRITENSLTVASNRDQLRASYRRTKTSTERVLRESTYCLGHVLCLEGDSAYVDGHQHVVRAPLFCIETPTRLIVIGNEAARALYPDAMIRLRAVKDAWCRLTRESRRSS